MANQPVLFYGISAMAEAGIDEVGIIVAPETGDEIREAAGDGSQFGVSITYIDQAEPLGLAHAVLTAEEFIGDSPFVMYLGDNLLRNGITDLVRTFEADAPDALILLTKVPDPENYGVAELAGDGRVSQARREAGRAGHRPGAGGRLHVHRRHLRRREARSSPRPAASSRSPTRSSTWWTAASASTRTWSRAGGRTPARWPTCSRPTG